MQATMNNTERPRRLLGVDDHTFRTQFDETSFIVSHQLADHPLFEFTRLFQFLKAENSDVYWDMGDVKVNQRWSEVKPASLSVDEAFGRIETANAWMIFRSIQRDPEYRAMLEGFIKEIEERSGVDFKKDVKVKDAIIFVTSPGRIATYHIDRECSFLLQIKGDKTVYVFDKNDRTVITEEELERYWTVDNNAATYKEQHQNRAQAYELVPGNGVHIPVGAPHWVKNHNNVSISLNFNIHFHDSRKGNIYRANHFLRKAGLKPTPPGRSKLRDSLKSTVVGGLIGARRIARGKKLDVTKAKDGGPPWKGD
jgi:hypothetical protein